MAKATLTEAEYKQVLVKEGSVELSLTTDEATALMALVGKTAHYGNLAAIYHAINNLGLHSSKKYKITDINDNFISIIRVTEH